MFPGWPDSAVAALLVFVEVWLVDELLRALEALKGGCAVVLVHVSRVVVPVHEAHATQLTAVGGILLVHLLDVTLQAVDRVVAVVAILTLVNAMTEQASMLPGRCRSMPGSDSTHHACCRRVWGGYVQGQRAVGGAVTPVCLLQAVHCHQHKGAIPHCHRN